LITSISSIKRTSNITAKFLASTTNFKALAINMVFTYYHYTNYVTINHFAPHK
jgi:hypothetical protein